MNKRLTVARRFRLFLVPRSALRSPAAQRRHCSLSLARLRRQGAHLQQYRGAAS